MLINCVSANFSFKSFPETVAIVWPSLPFTVSVVLNFVESCRQPEGECDLTYSQTTYSKLRCVKMGNKKTCNLSCNIDAEQVE